MNLVNPYLICLLNTQMKMNVLRINAVMTACARTTMVDTTVNAMPLVTIKSITKESVNVRFF